MKGLENKEKAGIFQPAVCIGDPNGIGSLIARRPCLLVLNVRPAYSRLPANCGSNP
jgi:hypothetical protein